MGAAFTTCPVAHVKRFLTIDVPAFGASLTGREPLVGNDERSTEPLAFVPQAADDLPPSCLCDVAGQSAVLLPAVLLHVLHREVLDHNHVEVTGEPRGQLLDKSIKSLRRS